MGNFAWEWQLLILLFTKKLGTFYRNFCRGGGRKGGEGGGGRGGGGGGEGEFEETNLQKSRGLLQIEWCSILIIIIIVVLIIIPVVTHIISIIITINLTETERDSGPSIWVINPSR